LQDLISVVRVYPGAVANAGKTFAKISVGGDYNLALATGNQKLQLLTSRF
jgi:hypothetical protein